MAIRRWFRPLLAPSLAVALGGCDALKLGVMNAAGPIAASERHLYIVVAIVLVFVAGPVLLLTPLFAWHYRLSNKNHAFKPKWNFSWGVEGLIWIPPTGIVIGLSILLWDYTQRLDPYRPIASAQPTLEVQAVALDWKWLFLYPGQRIATINQLAIPVGRPVHITLTSGTVMQSMLVPQLAGQIYAMAGMKTELNLAADRPGIYTGENTQYNGDGFAKQKFAVVALPPAGYAQWLARVRGAKRPLDAAAYARLFRRSTEANTVFFSRAPPGLFRTIMMQAHSGAVAVKP